MKADKTLLFLAAAALAAHFVAARAFIRSAAPTYDETVHLARGYSILATGRYDMVPTGHPPLAEIAGALPLLALRPGVFVGHPYFIGNMAYHYGDLFLYDNVVPPERLLGAARGFSLLLWSGLTAFFIWLFAGRSHGPSVAAASVAVFSLMPVFISNNALVATDAASSALYLGAFCLAYMFSSMPAAPKPPRSAWSRKRLILAALAGLLSGLAMAAKFNMFVVPPLVLSLWTADNLMERRVRPAALAGYAALYLVCALFAAAAVYGFDLAPYASGLRDMFGMLDRGRSSFAWGHYGLEGVWWYFPLALAVKTPLAALALALAGAVSMARSFRKEYIWLLVPPLVYFIAASASKMQIGFRHVMPALTFMAILAGIGTVSVARSRVLPAAAAPLLLLWGWGLVRTWPHYLAYFNELAGGPANGYKFLVDSNLDWGQDVKALADRLAGMGNPPVVFSYFGVARPERYGIRYVPLGVVSNVELRGTGEDLCRAEELLLAVSATNLQGTYYPDRDTYGWLKERKPGFSAGYSIFLYDLSADRDGTSRLAGLFDRNGMNEEAECLYARLDKGGAAKAGK